MHAKAGISQDEIKTAESKYSIEKPDGKNFPDSIYRAKRNKPLLMLHVLDCRTKPSDPKEKTSPLFSGGIVGYGISFPGEAGSRTPKKLVEYMVNTVWWNSKFADLLDEEESGNE